MCLLLPWTSRKLFLHRPLSPWVYFHVFINQFVHCEAWFQPPPLVLHSPWYIRTGWLGVKHQVTYLLTLALRLSLAIAWESVQHIDNKNTKLLAYLLKLALRLSLSIAWESVQHLDNKNTKLLAYLLKLALRLSLSIAWESVQHLDNKNTKLLTYLNLLYDCPSRSLESQFNT